MFAHIVRLPEGRGRNMGFMDFRRTSYMLFLPKLSRQIHPPGQYCLALQHSRRPFWAVYGRDVNARVRRMVPNSLAEAAALK